MTLDNQPSKRDFGSSVVMQLMRQWFLHFMICVMEQKKGLITENGLRLSQVVRQKPYRLG